MSSSLLSGVSGLDAYQQMLDVVGNNLANLNTTGYKSQELNFGDLLYQTIRSAAGSTTNGVDGTNPIQIGLGVGADSISTNLQQGSLQSTGNDLDLAIQGNGFFVANDGSQNLYTRAGSFEVDQDGYLVDPATGYRIQRYGNVGEGSATSPAFQTPGDESIKIPIGSSIPGKATSTVNFQGNLTASANGPAAQTLITTQPFTVTNAGVTSAATATSLLTGLDGSTVQPGDTISITGTNSNGTAVSTSFTITKTSTLGDLVTALNGAFTGATASIDTNGNLVMQSNSTGPSSLALTLADGASNTGTLNFSSHSMALSVSGTNGDTLDTAIQVYDSQGTAHNVSLTFQKTANNTWNLTASINASDGTMINGQVSGIVFNDDGSFRQVTGNGGSAISVQFTGMSAPQMLNLSFGTPNGFNGLTQSGGTSSASATGQDGYAAGSMTSVSVAQDGTIEGIFTNGQTLPVAQLAVAGFTNPGGLTRVGDNYFSLSNNSGLPQVGAAGSAGQGTIQHGELEQSNVDVALEFTRLITAQRGFQVNARTITVSDEVLQELANIIQ